MIKSRVSFVALIALLGLICVDGQLTFYLPSDKVSEGPCDNPPPSVATNLKAKWVNSWSSNLIFYHDNQLKLKSIKINKNW